MSDIEDIILKICAKRTELTDKAIFGTITEIIKDNECLVSIEVNETAIVEALEKQIPKKAILHGHNPYKLICSVHYTCPNCNKHISITPYCDKCGQALDWSDTE